MVELTRTNDPILLSWLEATLAANGIGCVILDVHTSVLEGSIGAIQRRVMVEEIYLTVARRVVADGELLRNGALA